MLVDHPDGQSYDRADLIEDAQQNFRRYGYFGLSLFAVSKVWPLDRLLGERAWRARLVALYTAGALRGSGLGLVPSGRDPHYDTTLGDVYGSTYGGVQVTAATAEELADRFLAASYTVVQNPHQANRRPT